ncbi:MAG TPA: DUF1003 domain-containing protein [Vicinamibacterales bacterium]|nr:DUF1003 domain-containing protein [Vicinamibacterales bacterium]
MTSSAESRTSSSIAEENIRAVANLRTDAERRRSAGERLGDAIAALAARESTVVVHVVWFAVWALVNTGRIGGVRPFDPFPFTLLTTLVSLEAIFLTLFVLASQNRLTQDADRRAHLDLQVNLLAEQEMTMVLRMLREVCDHLDLRETTSSPTFLELVRRTDVQDLAQRVDAQLESGAAGRADAGATDGGTPAGEAAVSLRGDR